MVRVRLFQGLKAIPVNAPSAADPMLEPGGYPIDPQFERQPSLPHIMLGGPNNPLGARAMYLGSTLYRIHGSNEPDTIGQAVSSGCIRMTNNDVIDLYDRVHVGAKVVVQR